MAKKKESPKLVTRKHIARKEREEKQIKSAVVVTGIVIGLALLLLVYVLVDNFIVQPNKVVARVGDVEIKAGDFESNVTYSRSPPRIITPTMPNSLEIQAVNSSPQASNWSLS